MLENWNVALNMFLKIKNDFIKEFGVSELYNYSNKINISDDFDYINKYNLFEDEEPLYSIKSTVLGYWVARLVFYSLDYLEYAKIIQPLELNQYHNMLLMRYGDDKSMWEDDFWDRYDGLYRECRSVVIDVKNDALIMTPFRKFFNLNERPETNFDIVSEKIKNAKVIEFTDKLDGSMQCARFYLGEYLMSGSQSVNPESSWRLEDGYSMLASNYKLMLATYPECTFIFEYISERDAHVVKYDKSQEGLYLIGVREVHTGVEWNYNKVLNCADFFNVLTTKTFDKDFNTILDELDDKTSDEAEGFVINIDGLKVKLKYNDYTQVHRVLSKIASINVVIQTVADGTFDDLYSKIPNAHKPRILRLANIIKDYELEIKTQATRLFNEAKSNTDNVKDLMIYIDSSNYSKKIQGFAKCIYRNKPLTILKKDLGPQSHYIKFNEIEKYYGGKIDVN